MAINLEDLTIPIWVYDIDNYAIGWANSAALKLWESDSFEELYSRDFSVLMSDALKESLIEFQASFKQGYTLTHNWHFSPKGIDKHAFCQLSGYKFDDGRTGMLVEALPIDKQNYDMQTGLTVMLSDYSINGNFISANPPFLQAMGREIHYLQDLVIDASVLKTLHRSLSQTGRFESDVLMRGARGDRWYHLVAVSIGRGYEAYESRKILLHQYDIHQRKISEIALAQEALSDSLTGLLNRRGLEKSLDNAEQQQRVFVLYYIDLDGFKLINDSLGHSVGDQVLQTVADRLLECLPDSSSICRSGGDEFIGVVPLQSIMTTKEQLAADLVSSLSGGYGEFQSHAMTLSASIGVAQYPQDSTSIHDVILYADAAMYQAKHLGKRRWVSYIKGMEQVTQRQSLISQHLYYAEGSGELSLHYQPIWDFSDSPEGRIVSFEALLRWHNDVLGWVPPEETVQVAEEIGIIDDIECWVAQQAMSDLLVLRDIVAPGASMAINVSAVHLLEPTLPHFLLSLVNDKGLQTSDLTVELTEGALVEDIDKENSVVRQLVALGFKISIDDFGTGYSSLAYLHYIPATIVKIDRSFVEQIDQNSKTVRHIRKLIETHNMQALIEGVETKQQKEQLIKFGIYFHQGYFLGKPKPLSFYMENKNNLNFID